uniref:Uncharacterized protein n=1 Tax=Acrobeloides nanus TaxID=290746 RepID=A0A914DCQ3_9BILA
MIVVLCIGIDRLICVAAPVRYRSINSSIYISMAVLVAAGYSCIWVILSWRMTMTTKTYSWNEQRVIRTADEYTQRMSYA